MIRTKLGVNKTERSDLFLYSGNAANVLSFYSGSVQIQLSLDHEIKNGIYSLCSIDKYFSDYLLFSVNQEDVYFTYPGIYAAFSPYGIIFTIWTRYGRYSILDTSTNVSENESFLIEFCWDSTRQSLGSGATMAIFINETCTSSGNYLIKNETISDLNFFAFDSKRSQFNLDCVIQDFVCYSELPSDKINSVESIKYFRFDDDEIVLGGRTSSLLWSGGATIASKTNLSSLEFLPYTIGICDITGNVYSATCFDDGYKSSFISKFDMEQSEVTNTLRNLKYPISLSIIQKDGIDYPKNIYLDNSSCEGLWVASNDKLYRTDEDLVVEKSVLGFGNISCVKCMNDKSCWIADESDNFVKHISYDGEVLESISISSPIYLAVTDLDDVYVYSESDKSLTWIKEGVETWSVDLGDLVIAIDTHPKLNIVVVAYSDGTVKRYSRGLSLLESVSVTNHISALCVRRGYMQEKVLVVNPIDAEILICNIQDLTITYKSLLFDKSILFNGCLAATAKSVGIETDVEASFDVSFTVAKEIVKNVKIDSYKVDKRNVDLSGGGQNEEYDSLKEIISENNPTDYQGDIVEAFELKDD